MALTFDPPDPWFFCVALLVPAVAALLLARGLIDLRRGLSPWRAFARDPRIRAAVLFFSFLAAVFFLFAALNPFTIRERDPDVVHLQLLLDVSDSVLRAEGGWPAIRQQVGSRLAADLASTSQRMRARGTAGIVTFRDSPAVAQPPLPLDELGHAFYRLEPNLFAAGAGTQLEAGLMGAASSLERAGGRGAVLLVSDGNQTGGDALGAAQRLARSGIPIHVYPIAGQRPALAIAAADLPRQVRARGETYVRGTIYNGRDHRARAGLSLDRNPGLPASRTRFGPPGFSQTPLDIPPGNWARFRWPLSFEGDGLQFVDLALSSEEGQPPHRRRFFTRVMRPPRILSIGGDHRWSDALPNDAFEVIHTEPSDLDGLIDFRDFDAMVISGVPARHFSKSVQTGLAEAVTRYGAGLLLLNGGHQGADEEAQTVLMSFNDTPLEPLLPLSSRSRPREADPAPRQVVILVDTSGSMSGPNLEKAKEIAGHIVANLLRAQDRLDFITFSTGAQHLIDDAVMTAGGKSRALGIINGLTAGGGTDPTNALALIGGRTMSDCGLIFISDGEFANLTYRPDCRATVFAIGKSEVPESSPLWALADPFPVGRDFDPSVIEIPYFKLRKRYNFFERGEYNPISMNRFLRRGKQVYVPELPLDGSAVTWLKEGAVLSAVRPKLTDPVLAFQESGQGLVAVFVTEIPGQWLRRVEGRRAVQSWISLLLPFTAHDRYDFKIEDHGTALDMRLALVPKAGIIPRVDAMTARIHFPGGGATDIPLRPDTAVPGIFNGRIRVERGDLPKEAVLSLEEAGADALPRAQRIPLLIPSKGTVRATQPTETYTFGLNQPLLRDIAAAGGGHYDPSDRTPFFHPRRTVRRGRPLWPWLVIAAVSSFLFAIAFQRWDP